MVRSFVARQVISCTWPSRSPIAIQWPTRNGFSIWIASPENRFPSVSCRAKPTTTAPTADVVSSCSFISTVATIVNSPISVTS